MKTRVLIWSEYFSSQMAGGAEILCSKILTAMKSRGFEFQIICNQSTADLPPQGSWEEIPIHRFPFHQALQNDFSLIKKIRGQISRIKSDWMPRLIHCHSSFPSIFFDMITHKEYPLARLFTLHADFPFPASPESYFRKYLALVDYLTSVSQFTLDNFKKSFPQYGGPFRLIPNALPNPPSLERPSDWKNPILGCLGRLHVDKGFDVAIQALQILRQRFPHVRLQIAGVGPEGENLKGLVKKLGLDKAIDFVGWIPNEEVGQWIQSVNFLLIPSRWEEPFGLVALEAAQQGRPVIASKVGGLAQVVCHEETGLLVEKEDHQALAEAAGKLIENPELATQQGERAQRHVRENYCFKKMIDKYEEVYNEILMTPTTRKGRYG